MVTTFEQLRTKNLKTFDELRAKPTDLGMIAIRREKLPGVWDYDKQLEALLGDPERPIEDFIPWDVKYDFGRIVGMTTKPSETKDKMTMSLVYSVLLNESVAKTHSLIDELNKVAFRKPIQVERALKEYRDYYTGAKSYVGAITHGLRRANIMAQKQIGGLAKMVGEFIDPQERVRPLFPALKEWEKRNADVLTRWGDMILADVEDYYRENKAEAIQILPGIGFWNTIEEYITNPVNLVQAIVESGPMMLEGTLGAVVGGPAAMVALMAVPIWGDVYSDARADGTEPLPAMAQAILTGTGEATIEAWTLGRKLGLMRNFRKLVADGLPKVLWEGTKAFFRGTAEEGSQEFNRNFWRWVFTDRSQQWSENVAESMAAGGPMEMVMAGAFSAAGAVGPVVPKEQQIERLDKIQEAIEVEPTLTEEHKVEIRKELDIVRKDIGEDVYISEEEAEKPPTEAVVAPEKPVAPITPEKAVGVAEIEKEVQRAGITSEDFELKPEKMKELGLEKIAMKVKGKIYAFEYGEKGVFNHADVLQKAGIPDVKTKDIVPGYLDNKGRFIEQFEAKPKAVEVAKAEIIPPDMTYDQWRDKIAEIARKPIKERTTTDEALRATFPQKEVRAIDKKYEEQIDQAMDALSKLGALDRKKQHRSLSDWPKYKQKIITKNEAILDKAYSESGKETEAFLKDYFEKLIAKPKAVVKAEPRKVEVKPVEAEEKARPLRQKIHAIAAVKGLTKKALSDLKLKHTGYRKLTGKIASKKITLEQLQNLLKAVQKARPKRVGYKRVITKKTEKKIQSLKENLIKKTQMTERHFDEILEIEIQGREPKYIDAKKFITETQGKDIIKRMLDTAEIVRLTESFEQAIAKNPEIADRVKLLDSRIEKAPKRDPFSLESMRYYNQQAEIKTGAPIFTSYMDLMDTHLEIVKTRTATWKRFEKTTPKFKEIAKDEKALQRISDYIASQSALKEKPAMPTDITVDEIKLAKEIQKILEEYRLKVRVTKFYNWYYYNQPIPDHDRYVTEITKATDIYESKGREELIEYLETQEWGVIKSGYEPLEILFHKIRPYTTGPAAVGKGHIKIRTDIEYHRQERNILQRLSSYMRQIDMLYNLSPKINAYVRLFDDNAGKFSDWGKVKNDIEIFLRNLKRYNIEGGFFQRVLSRAYSQAMRVIIMPSPVLSFRNLFQNAAFEHDKTILIDPRNTKLSSKDIEYLETYILQTRAMVEEYFMVGEKPLPMLKTLTKMIDKVKIYPYSDIANRHWSFWAKTNQVDRALKADTTKQMMTEARFEDMKELEQRRALGILARDGKEAMTQYVGRVHVDDIHFLYERSQRSPAEMTSLGKIVGNLMLFPRAYGEKLAHATNKALKGKTYEEQWRGMKTLFAVIGGGMIAGSIYMKVTGRKRNPYNPLDILAFRPGGLAWGSIEAATEIYANILSAAKGDSRALAALTTAIPRAADMFIPFYDYSLRAIEAATDQKNIDRKALRQMRMIVDKEYKIRGGAYKVKRNALEKWQYFLSGPSAEKEKKVSRPKAITW